MAYSTQSASAARCTTPSAYARRLLDSLGLTSLELTSTDSRPAAELWARSGAMWLTGHADGDPRPCPAPLALCAQGTWLALTSLPDSPLAPGVDAFQWLGERAAIAGYHRAGRISPGGACRLYDTLDGTIALNLARDSDGELLPAWLQLASVDTNQLADTLRDYTSITLLQRARLLGLAVAPVVPPRPATYWYHLSRMGNTRAPHHSSPLVIDLSTLWAGPLCGQLLFQSGARVIKVESEARPDGARRGPQPFYDLMNAGKESVALDLRLESGRQTLRALLRKADIVIESARPRGLAQMGILAEEIVQESPGKVWLSITGYGLRSPMGDWIAYGDDAGVAAGLSWLMGGDSGDPVFCGDAIADPLTGLHAALLALASWQAGGGVLLDVALSQVVSYCIEAGCREPRPALQGCDVAPPQARPVEQRARALGEDSQRVLSELL